jgi:hypothetical protein
MRLFISKYELRMSIFEEHHLHHSENTLSYRRKQSCDITKM